MSKEMILIQVGAKKCQKTYSYENPGTPLGLAYQVFCELAKEFPKDQQSVQRTFSLQETTESKRVMKYLGTRKVIKENKKYKFKYFVKPLGCHYKN